MKQEYIITPEELALKGLIINNYALDDTFIPAIINVGLDQCVTRISYLNDDLKGEVAIEKQLDNEPEALPTFKKLQYRVIYNLIFMGETDPTDNGVDNIIAFELGWSKINGWQKGIHHKE